MSKNRNEMVSLFPKNEVRRCPFCGGAPVLVGKLGIGGRSAETALYIICTGCSSRTEVIEAASQAECVSELVALWNGEKQSKHSE